MTVTGLSEYEVTPRLRAAAQRWRPGSEVGLIELMHGASSLTLKAELVWPDGARTVIVKVAPPGVEPTRNRDVLRQAAVLRELEGHPRVRTPRVLFQEPGLSLDEPPFFVMDFLAGDCVEPTLDRPLPQMPAPDVLRDRALDAMDVLAALHAVDIGSGILAFERPSTLEQEVARWERALGSVPEDLRPHADAVGRRLRATLPAPVAPALLHGDFRLGNLLCQGGQVQGVVDWEIWSVGDPRIDLLWFLLFTEPGRLPVAVRSAPGLPAAHELLAAYAAHSTRGPFRDLEWFDALIQFKQAAVTALIVKHNRRRRRPDAELDRIAWQIEPLMQRALALLD